KVVIFAAPSGSGKTTLVRYLLDQIPQLRFSVSATTRSKRDHEKDGHDYYFIEKSDFVQKIQTGNFLEWQEVYDGNYYGTLCSEIDRIWAEGYSVIFDVDVVGALNIKRYYGDQALAIFVKVPSIDDLKNRLQNRETETKESINIRLEKAAMEMDYEKDFDISILNDQVDTAKARSLFIVERFLQMGFAGLPGHEVQKGE
ncbi:UNVERIFIED_CONTAM: hypothetical protein GTU68_000429, partial [Idotea baltica]|nr:hypothetical protein [Idotea baltica]